MLEFKGSKVQVQQFNGLRALGTKQQAVFERRPDGARARRAALRYLACPPVVVLIEIDTGSSGGPTGPPASRRARLVPLPDVEDLPPRRMLPRRERRQAVPADAHHRRAVALDRHRAAARRTTGTETPMLPSGWLNRAACTRSQPRVDSPPKSPCSLSSASRIASRKMSSRDLALLHRRDVVQPRRIAIVDDRIQARGLLGAGPLVELQEQRARPSRRRTCAATARPRTLHRARPPAASRPRDPIARAARAATPTTLRRRAIAPVLIARVDARPARCRPPRCGLIVLQRRHRVEIDALAPSTARSRSREARKPAVQSRVIKPLKPRSISLFAE